MTDNTDRPDQEKVDQYRKLVEARMKAEAERRSGKTEKTINSKSENYDKAGREVKTINLDMIKHFLNQKDKGLGLLYEHVNSNYIIYEINQGQTYFWDGNIYELDPGRIRARDAVGCVIEILLQAKFEFERRASEFRKNGKDVEADTEIYYFKMCQKFINRCNTVPGVEACLYFAFSNSKSSMNLRYQDLNTNGYLLATKSEVVDIRTGKKIPPSPDQRLTKRCPVDCPDLESLPPNYAPRWRQFLFEILGSKEKVDFLQILLGLSIIGEVLLSIFVILIGIGRNGKTLLMKILSYVLGPFFGTVKTEFFIKQRYPRSSAAPSPDILSFKDKRIMHASENSEGTVLDGNVVKLNTGGDSMSGRNPHDRIETIFTPSHTLYFSVNSPFSADANDFALWERAIRIDFPYSFVNRDPQDDNERRADPLLFEKLKNESPFILAWLLEGALLYQRFGLQVPPEIRAATLQYRRSEDDLADFIDQCCVVGEDFSESAKDLYNSFSDWWLENVGKKIPSQKWFGHRLGKKFHRDKLGGRNYFYFGLKLDK